MRGSSKTQKTAVVLRMTVALFIAVSSCSIARGQLSAAQARELNQVYVRDSSLAIEKFALAERM